LKSPWVAIIAGARRWKPPELTTYITTADSTLPVVV